MRWVYLSPHFDDIALSCGGLVWEQVQTGSAVEIWTICAGGLVAGEAVSDFALSLHQRWEKDEDAVGERRKEDEAAARRLGAALRLWDLPDCIYRRLPDGRWLVDGEDDLWQPVHPLEEPLVQRLSDWLAQELRAGDALVSPLTLGNHVDHFLVRSAAEQTAAQLGLQIWFYPDYPYAVREGGELQGKIGPDWRQYCWTVSPEGLAAWQDAVQCYTSQISTFWGGVEEMRAALESYWRAGGGSCLWKLPP